MKIAQLVAASQRNSLPPMQKKVLAHLEAHPDEVFRLQDPELANALGLKRSALGWSLWALRRKGLIESVRVGSKTYFGSKEAITALTNRLKPSSNQ